MTPRACPTPGCPNLTDGGRCTDCQRQADQQRGTAHHRGYTGPRHRRFRRLVLQRDPLCALCGAIATVADHWPMSRQALTDLGRNPDDPACGRALCHRCHSRETGRLQPGGWHADLGPGG